MIEEIVVGEISLPDERADSRNTLRFKYRGMDVKVRRYVSEWTVNVDVVIDSVSVMYNVEATPALKMAWRKIADKIYSLTEAKLTQDRETIYKALGKNAGKT